MLTNITFESELNSMKSCYTHNIFDYVSKLDYWCVLHVNIDWVDLVDGVLGASLLNTTCTVGDEVSR